MADPYDRFGSLGGSISSGSKSSKSKPSKTRGYGKPGLIPPAAPSKPKAKPKAPIAKAAAKKSTGTASGSMKAAKGTASGSMKAVKSKGKPGLIAPSGPSKKSAASAPPIVVTPDNGARDFINVHDPNLDFNANPSSSRTVNWSGSDSFDAARVFPSKIQNGMTGVASREVRF